MYLDKLELIITNHAYDKYCSRVKQIDRDELADQCKAHIQSGNWFRQKEYIKLDGIWWVFSIVKQSKLFFITCYGETTHHLPSAKKWQRVNKDRVRLR
ncbi:hypothetical protein [Paenibacillus gansuensis]|uniref:Uncharacterized protein n=1 Tax=Paenibacillus gansuensis TaxID=306542 RepID=A0ABW5PF81_9BACL